MSVPEAENAKKGSTQGFVKEIDVINALEMKKHHSRKHSYSKVPIVPSTDLI
jgi:hypothetical protein